MGNVFQRNCGPLAKKPGKYELKQQVPASGLTLTGRIRLLITQKKN